MKQKEPIETSFEIVIRIDVQDTQFTIQTIAYGNIYRVKSEGRLGVKKTKDAHIAFLAKQGQKVLNQQDNIWVQLIKAKYLKKNTIFSKLIILMQRLLLGNIFQIINIVSEKVYGHCGKSINFLYNNQMKNSLLINKINPHMSHPIKENVKVNDSITPTKNWNIISLVNIIPTNIINWIKVIPILVSDLKNRIK